MKSPRLSEAITRDESGAITVNWPLLSAAVSGIVMVAMVSIGAGITGLGDALFIDMDSRLRS